MVVHQLLSGSRTENYTFRKGDNVVPKHPILKKFNYIACGHVHRFQFLYQNNSPTFKSTNKIYKANQDQRTNSWHFHDICTNHAKFSNPIIAYAGSLERVSFMEKNEPKGYLIGELKRTNKPKNTWDSSSYKTPIFYADNRSYIYGNRSIDNIISINSRLAEFGGINSKLLDIEVKLNSEKSFHPVSYLN